MSRQKLQDGKIHKINTQVEFDFIINRGWVRCRIGTFTGPGVYLELNYTKPCPRGCCEDLVVELLSANEVFAAVERENEELSNLVEEIEDYAK